MGVREHEISIHKYISKKEINTYRIKNTERQQGEDKNFFLFAGWQMKFARLM